MPPRLPPAIRLLPAWGERAWGRGAQTWLFAAATLLPTVAGSPHAQPPPDAPLVRAWTTADGLPVNHINGLAQTPDGWLWVATSAGVLRSDGLNFRLYGQDELQGWRTTFVGAMHVDRRGRLWLGSTAGEIGRIGADGRFRHFGRVPAAPGRDPPGMGNTRAAMVEEAGGAVWFAFGSGGVVRVGPDDRIAHFPLSDFPAREGVWALHLDASGRVYALTDRGLARFENGRFVAHGPRVHLRGGVQHGPQGSLVFFTAEGALARVQDGRLARTPLPRRFPFAPLRAELFRVSPDGGLWFLSPRGLHAWDGAQLELLVLSDSLRYEWPIVGGRPEGVFWLLQHQPDVIRHLSDGGTRRLPLPPGFRPGNVTATLTDAEGTLWLGTNAGLVRYTPRRVRAVTRADGLPHEFVFPTLATRDGAVWAGTWGGGLARFGPDGRVSSITTSDGLPTNHVRALLEDRRGRLWVGGVGSTIAVVRGGRVVSTVAPPDPTGHNSVVLHQDRAGTIRVGGEWLYRVREVGPDRFVMEGEPSPARVVRALHEDARGRLWAGGRNGLFVRESGRWQPFAPLGDTPVVTLVGTADGVLWVGTQGAGLWRIERDGRFFTYTRARHGLHHDGIWWVEPDGRGALWMSSDAGLARYSRRELDAVAAGQSPRLSPLVLGEADGMPSAEGCTGKPGGARDRRGRLWFPTIHGLAVVDPAAVRLNRRPPPVHVTGVLANGQPVAPDSLDLPAGTRNVAFHYAALSLVRPEANRFRYRLDGYDRAWVEAGERREVTYAGLGPGRYTFRVQGSNSDGVWNEAGTALGFAVAPFWWQTPWALALAGLAALGLALGGVRYRERRMRTVELERLVQERTAALREEQALTQEQADRLAEQSARLREADALKSRFFQNASHEFRTPLQLILAPVADLLAGKAGSVDDAARRELGVVEKNARRLDGLVRQLFDLTRLEAGALRPEKKAADLAALVRETVEAHAPLAERNGVGLGFRADAAACPAVLDPEQARTALANLVGNALRFTPRGGKVLVSLAAADGEARIAVRDDGPGIAADRLPRLFERFWQGDGALDRPHEGLGIGLSLAKELAELNGGRIEVETTEGFGATFTLVLPCVLPEGAPEPASSSIETLFPSPPRAEGAGGGVAPSSEPNGDGVASSPEPDAPDGRPLVLVVEDNADVRALVRRHLGAEFRVVEAVNGAEGLEKARALRPDLVVADVMMPGGDGLALVRALRADRGLNDVPVVLLTARAGAEAVQEGLAAGADAYVEKPFDAATLLAHVRRLLESRSALRARYRREVVLAPTGALLRSEDEVFLERVRQAVSERMGEHGFNAEALAEEVGLSRSQFTRRLRTAAGTSPHAFLLEMRLLRAAELLAARVGRVKEVAQQIGFSNAEHFAKLFHERFGVYPSVYLAVGSAPADGAPEPQG